MKNLTSYLNTQNSINEEQVNEMRFENDTFDEYANYCFRNNKDVINRFKYLLEQFYQSYYKNCTMQDLIDEYADGETAADEADYLDELSSLADNNDSYYNAYYNAFDLCRGDNINTKRPFINELCWKYCKEKFDEQK